MVRLDGSSKSVVDIYITCFGCKKEFIYWCPDYTDDPEVLAEYREHGRRAEWDQEICNECHDRRKSQ